MRKNAAGRRELSRGSDSNERVLNPVSGTKFHKTIEDQQQRTQKTQKNPCLKNLFIKFSLCFVVNHLSGEVASRPADETSALPGLGDESTRFRVFLLKCINCLSICVFLSKCHSGLSQAGLSDTRTSRSCTNHTISSSRLVSVIRKPRRDFCAPNCHQL